MNGHMACVAACAPCVPMAAAYGAYPCSARLKMRISHANMKQVIIGTCVIDARGRESARRAAWQRPLAGGTAGSLR